MALTLPVISGTKDSASASAGTGRPARRGLTRRGELKMSEGFVFPPRRDNYTRGDEVEAHFCSGAYRLRAAGPTATNTNGSHQTARREKHNPTSEIRPAEKQDVPPPSSSKTNDLYAFRGTCFWASHRHTRTPTTIRLFLTVLKSDRSGSD